MLKLAVAAGLVVVSTVLVGACGGDPEEADSSGTDGIGPEDSGAKKKSKKVVSDDGDSGVADASRPATWTPSFPQVESYGGPVIAKPKVLPIVFQNDTSRASIDTFMKQLAASSYWVSVAKEYGVGELTALPSLVIKQNAPTNVTSGDVTTLLENGLSGASPLLGTPDPNTLYALFYPSGTVISDPRQGTSCQSYGAYHSEISVNGKAIGYSLHPRCKSFGGTSEIDSLTVGLTHEIYEWATDPFPSTNPAYVKMDAANCAWGVSMFGELSDLCTYIDREPLSVAGISYGVQRHWSNALSAAGGYPCAPTKSTTYVQAIPRTEDPIRVWDLQTRKPTTTTGVLVPPGETREVDVMIYSDSSTSEAVQLAEPYRLDQFNQYYEPSGFSAYIKTMPQKTGDFAKLVITAPTGANKLDILTFVVRGDDASNTYYWSFTVANADGASEPLMPSFPDSAFSKQPNVIRAMKPIRR